jgi:hypothetical protein
LLVPDEPHEEQGDALGCLLGLPGAVEDRSEGDGIAINEEGVLIRQAPRLAAGGPEAFDTVLLGKTQAVHLMI